MRRIALLLYLACLISLSLGQYVETTVYLPDSLSGLDNVNSLLYHSPNNTIYVGGDDYFLVAVDAQTNTKLARVGLGGGPHLLCSDRPGNKLYCTNAAGSVTVVDGATNHPVKTLPVEQAVTVLIYVERDNKLYLGNASDTLLRVIDCAADRIAARIPVGPGPRALCYNPRLDRVYCVTDHDDVVVIDCAADTIVGTVWMRGVGPHDICYDSATDCVYATNSASGSVSVIDCAGDTFIRLVPVGREPAVIEAGPPGKVYCANRGDGSVSIIADSGVKTLRTVRQPGALSYDPLNGKVYCAGGYSDSVAVIDAAGDSVLVQVQTDYSDYTAALCYNPAGNNTYVVCRGSVANVVSGVSDSVEAVLTFWSSRPGPLCYNTGNNHLYCLDPPNNLLFIIDGDSNQILKILTTGRGSRALIWSSASNKVYFANTSDNTVSILDCTSDSIVATLVTGYQPSVLCCSDDGRVFVGNDEDGVAVVDGTGDSVRAVIPAAHYVRTLCYDRTDNKVYFGTYYGDTVSVIDAGGDSVVATIALPGSGGGSICWNQNHDKLYTCCPGRDSVTIIDCRSDTVLRSISVSAGLGLMYSDSVCDKVYCADNWYGCLRIIKAESDSFYKSVSVAAGAAVLLDNGEPGPANRLYCTDGSTDQVTVVQAYKTDTVLSSIHVGYGPDALAWNPVYSRIYVSNSGSSSITVIRDTLGPGPDIEEAMTDGRGTMDAGPTVVRGILFMPEGSSRRPRATSLMDVSGRLVMSLQTGANDVRRLSPGVYFVRDEGQGTTDGGHVRKVVVTR